MTTTQEKRWEREAKALSECSDVMPKTLTEHQNRIYNACLDMIYKIKERDTEIIKEINNLPIRGISKDLEGIVYTKDVLSVLQR